MVLGDVQRTRRLAGNPVDTNVSDTDITSYLSYGTAMVRSHTGFDFEANPTNPNFNAAVMAAEYFASSAIRDRFGDKDDISQENFDRAMAIITDVSNNLIAAGGAGVGTFSLTKGAYRSYPLNPNALVYSSLKHSGAGGYLGEDVEGPRA